MHLKKSRLKLTPFLTIATLTSALLVPVALAESPTHTHSSATPGMNSGAMGSHDMDMGHHGMKMTGDVDYDFALMMRMHHEKGVKMAQKELDKGKDPDMRAAAKKIVEAQKKEIAEFDKWLAEHPQKSK